jgi:1-phosphofructokinase family hexose kinase
VILCVGPNPAIDRLAVVERLELGAILRPTEVVVQAGGKALNVARAARTLGALVTSTGIVGGQAGRWLAAAAAEEGLSPRFIDGQAETRTTYVVVDRRGRSISVYEPSAPVAASELDALVRLVRDELLPSASRVAVAGSVPTGADGAVLAGLVDACHESDRSCLVDTSGAALAAVLAARPSIVKVSLDEAREAGIAAARADMADAARAIAGAGAAIAIVTDGALGAAASDGRSRWQVAAAPVAAVSTVGAGDAFSAGLLVALEAGRSMDEALAWGAAAGAANCEMIGAGRLDADRHAALVAKVTVARGRERG